MIPKLCEDEYGTWIIDHESKGTLDDPIQMPFVGYSRAVNELEKAIYAFVSEHPEYELTEYSEILETNGLKWESRSMSEADVSHADGKLVMALLVGALRADRFCEGALLGFLEDGSVARWLERLKEIDEADNALRDAGIRTVMNMADSDQSMKRFADFGLTAYSQCDIIALDMTMNYDSDDFRKDLADGFRYIASHEGPYLIHCVEGKDRTGYAAAILECLMGAGADEVVKDYMITYYNFYGIEAGTDQYKQIAASNIEAVLAKAFGIKSIYDDGADLSSCAEVFLKDIGMNDDEITSLKENLIHTMNP
ncbi:MAG: tyrosine-protein phosphatase [Mogibacterium sp.]|nr:tyrosine-protein phosphatase [Mogibacterium sp.]